MISRLKILKQYEKSKISSNFQKVSISEILGEILKIPEGMNLRNSRRNPQNSRRHKSPKFQKKSSKFQTAKSPKFYIKFLKLIPEGMNLQNSRRNPQNFKRYESPIF
jgi:hypothetical protein